MRSHVEHLEAATRLAERATRSYAEFGANLALMPEAATVVDWASVNYADYEADENDDEAAIKAVYETDGDVTYRIPVLKPAVERDGLTWALAVIGFVAAALTVWRLA
jgi:hypothetical protein